MKKIVSFILLIFVVISSVFSFNYFTLIKPYDDMFKADYRNKGVDVSIYYKNYINPDVLVFDLKNIEGTNSMLDVFRILWSYAGAIKHKKFEKVELAFRGDTKFYLKGDYFNSIGENHGIENPIYVMHHFPENVYKANNSRAFGSWSGGWLGVAQKQMEDFNNFHKQWYLNELFK